MAFDFGSLLQQYVGGNAVDPAQAEQDFGQVAQHAAPAAVASGVKDAFHSDQTPPFAQMVGQLFFRSDAQQRAGIVNQLLANVSPEMLTSLANSIGNFFTPGDKPHVSPEQTEQITPAQVEEIAATAEQHNPGIVDQVASFYAQHPALVQTLGGAALGIVMNKIAQAHR